MLFFLALLLAPQQRLSQSQLRAQALRLASQVSIAPESSAAGLRVIRGTKAGAAPRLDGVLDDSVWATAPVARDSLGWTAEFRIPLSQLRYSVSSERPGTWGINFYRNISRRQEWSSWAPVRIGEHREVSQFGELTEMDFLRPARRREITPYVSTGVTRSPGDRGDPFFQRTAFGKSAGFDAKLGLNSGLTLDLTVHPDFGQDEADPSEVNISGFETTFQERRPFFVENGGLFTVPIYESSDEVLFYPRRIGRAPEISADSTALDVRETGHTTIAGAAKISGKL